MQRAETLSNCLHLIVFYTSEFHSIENCTKQNSTFHIELPIWILILIFILNSYLNETLDGKNLWPALSDDTKSDRTEILHNIDDIYGSASLTVGEWKVHKGTNYNGNWDQW